MQEKIKKQVRRLQSDADCRTTAWINGYTLLGKKIFCSDNCSNCCSLAVNCTWPEALCATDSVPDSCSTSLNDHVKRLRSIITDAVDFKSFLRMHRQNIESCPFLDNGSCSIYSDRPISCRSLLSTKESYWCGADFGNMESEEKHSFIESLDREVVELPMHYVAATRDIGQNMEVEISGIMTKHLGFSLYGNFTLMVFLNIEHGFAEKVCKGFEATIDFLEKEGLNHPYLISISQ